MLAIIQGNRLDRLAGQLLLRLAEADGEAFAPRIVVVPTAGMARWLKQRIACQLGVCAQVEFPYPAEFAWRLFARVLPGIAADSPFERDVLAWRLFALLGRLPAGAAWQAPRDWLAAGAARERMELAARLAALFDQYRVHRPDWLAAWGEGRRLGLGAAEGWQAWLWRELLRAAGAASAQHPKEAFFAALAGEPAARERLPGRIAVFGVPLLAPLYLEILLRLAAHLPVDLYVPNPCREFWADIVAERELARLALRGEAELAHRELGQPLLAAWGRQSRDQLALVCALADEAAVGAEDFAPPAGASLLARVQRAIVELDDPPEGSLAVADDGSLRIHACHGLTRQIEVLHDELLAQFDRHPGLTPGDVVVMTPDIDAAAPAIDAVFGAAPRERRIPHAITGRLALAGDGVLAAMDAVAALAESRFEVGRILDLAAIPAVARRLGLGDDERETLHAWLREAGVRWGLDAAHRARLGLPAEPRHTWAAGLTRLLLGYAMADAAGEAPGGAVPLAGVEGRGALALGRLLRLLAVLAEFLRRARRARPPAAWSALLNELAGALIDAREDEADELQRYRQALAAFAATAAAAGTDEAIPLAVVRERLAAILAASAPGAVPSGVVTFCGIGPLRGLPYRVVCLVGLDAETFPRRSPAAEFDLMAARPRLGDRARHDDDRGAFLDAFTAAGDAFIVTYTGRDLRDNAAREPALPVAELVAYLARRAAGGRAALAGRVCCEHPLQPFSPRYFDAAAPRSYAAELIAAARVVAGLAPRRAAPALAATVPVPAAVTTQAADAEPVERDELADFLRHPLRHFLRRRLGIALIGADEELPAQEPFGLGRRARWSLAERLLAGGLAGAGREALMRLARAAPELPHGAVGELELEAEIERVLAFAGRIGRATGAAPVRSLAVDLECAGFSLGGSLAGVYAAGCVRWRLGPPDGGDLAVAWLDHLLLQLLRPAGAAPATLLLAEGVDARFAPVERPAEALAALLGLYRDGLARPLAVAPRSAWSCFRSGPIAARTTWAGNRHHPGECAGRWFRLAYGGERSALPEGFEAAVEALLGPLRGHVDIVAAP